MNPFNKEPARVFQAEKYRTDLEIVLSQVVGEVSALMPASATHEDVKSVARATIDDLLAAARDGVMSTLGLLDAEAHYNEMRALAVSLLESGVPVVRRKLVELLLVHTPGTGAEFDEAVENYKENDFDFMLKRQKKAEESDDYVIEMAAQLPHYKYNVVMPQLQRLAGYADRDKRELEDMREDLERFAAALKRFRKNEQVDATLSAFEMLKDEGKLDDENVRQLHMVMVCHIHAFIG